MSSTLPVPVVRVPGDITASWLGEVLGQDGLRLDAVEAIGTGQMSQSHRVSFTRADGTPGTVVVKLASASAESRATGVGMRAYWREVSFYRGIASRIPQGLPACHHAAYDEAEGWFTLVLEDIAGAEQGDQIAGCDIETARLAIRTLARVHAPVLGDLHAGTVDYLNQPNPLNQALTNAVLPGFLERYAGRIAPEHADVCRRFAAVVDAWMADQRPPLGLVHGDYRLDNLLFSGGTCTVVDWQTVSWGPALYDLAYFIAGAFEPAVRREHERELVRLYHSELVAHGVTGLDEEHCWDEYRRQAFGGILMTIVASMVVERTDRGDDMFMAWLARNGEMILDLGSLELLPEEGAPPPAPLQPEAADDATRHEPGAEATWNESWYFDAVSDDGQLGMYTRLGRVPNQGVALFTAAIVGPGRPSIMLVDASAPLPDIADDAQVIDISGLRAEQHCEEPLRRFRVVVSGTAQAHEDPAAPLRGEEGTPVDVAFDLTWETDGVPYLWRQTSRYEIPCRVSGTIRVGDEEIAFAGVGQRDHSWGSRDWFATDWMWNGLHLEDGTHTHAVGIPTMPGFGVGYAQKDGVVEEVTALTATEEVGDDGLITSARITGAPAAVDVEVEPVAFGALLLTAPDGRTSHFPRAMCRVRTTDGRAGTGWIEWNRNQRADG